jgi:hypothetical protein
MPEAHRLAIPGDELAVYRVGPDIAVDLKVGKKKKKDLVFYLNCQEGPSKVKEP